MVQKSTKDFTLILPAADAISCAFWSGKCACVDDTLQAVPFQAGIDINYKRYKLMNICYKMLYLCINVKVNYACLVKRIMKKLILI